MLFLQEVELFQKEGFAYIPFICGIRMNRRESNFMKEQYGIGGQSHALSRADNSYADYNGKGLQLSRGNPGAYHTKEELSWQKVAKEWIIS